LAKAANFVGTDFLAACKPNRKCISTQLVSKQPPNLVREQSILERKETRTNLGGELLARSRRRRAVARARGAAEAEGAASDRTEAAVVGGYEDARRGCGGREEKTEEEERKKEIVFPA
jgi:hypothetical protein